MQKDNISLFPAIRLATLISSYDINTHFMIAYLATFSFLPTLHSISGWKIVGIFKMLCYKEYKEKNKFNRTVVLSLS